MKRLYPIFFASLFLSSYVFSAKMTIPIYSTTQPALSLGKVTAEDTQYGLLLVPDLHGLPSGIHGFHIHVNDNCAEHGMAAGGHLDPANTNQHLGPYNPNGHLGDLPVLIVNQDGTATLPVLAPRLSVKEIESHTLMIHEGGDNYSDTPEKLGGGGDRIACGVIK